jgi:uncharacterized protein (TIGR03067 family)
MRRYTTACLALAFLLGGGLRGEDRKVDKEGWKALNGTWEVVSAVADGKKQPPPKEKATVTNKDGKYTLKVGDTMVGGGTVKIDPSASPATVDITPSSGPDKGKSVLGIYEVKGDTLRSCIAPAGKPRPRAFESKEGSGHTLFTYKRVKPRE